MFEQMTSEMDVRHLRELLGILEGKIPVRILTMVSQEGKEPLGAMFAVVAASIVDSIEADGILQRCVGLTIDITNPVKLFNRLAEQAPKAENKVKGFTPAEAQEAIRRFEQASAGDHESIGVSWSDGGKFIRMPEPVFATDSPEASEYTDVKEEDLQ